MTRECIEDMREVVLPFVRKRLLEINYENLGESDAEEFTRNFNEILALAIKGLEQEPVYYPPCIDCNKKMYEIRNAYDNMTKALEQEPFINKPCVSSKVCEHDKQKVLDKIRAEIKGMTPTYHNPDWSITDLVPISKVIDVVDKYKAEIEPLESEDKK